MEYIKTNYRNILKYIFIFSIILIWNLFIQRLNVDEIWNFGFSYSIYKGEIPYVDFNMVVTPFSPFLFAIPFFIFGPSMFLFHIEGALIITFACYLLFKMFDKRAWYLILFLFLPISIIYPSYNILLFILFVFIIYLEENNKNDYLIGIILGLFVLTKQSVGTFMLLPSLYYLKNKNKFLKRICSFSIVMLSFIVYLFFTNSYREFLDLCLFGLFDFAGGNSGKNILFYLIFSFMVIVTLIFIRKDYKDIKNYYALAFYTIVIPLFDLFHIQMAFIAFLFLIYFKNKDKKLLFRPVLFTVSLIVFMFFLTFFTSYDKKKIIYPNNIKYFEYRIIDKTNIIFTDNVNNFIKNNKKEEIIFLDSKAYYFRICNDMKIGYLDLINRGNLGYNGSKKLINIIKSKKNSLILIDKINFRDDYQTDKNVLKYVIKNGKKIGKVESYDIYILN